MRYGYYMEKLFWLSGILIRNCPRLLLLVSIIRFSYFTQAVQFLSNQTKTFYSTIDFRLT